MLHLGQVVQGRLAWIPVYVAAAAGPEAFPTVRALWPGSSGAELAPGDAIAAVGGVSLAGATPLVFVTAVYQNAAARRVSLQRVRAGVAALVQLPLVPLEQPWRRSASGAAFALLGALAFWRTRGSRAGRAFYFGMTAYAFHSRMRFVACTSFRLVLLLSSIVAKLLRVRHPSVRWTRQSSATRPCSYRSERPDPGRSTARCLRDRWSNSNRTRQRRRDPRLVGPVHQRLSRLTSDRTSLDGALRALERGFYHPQ